MESIKSQFIFNREQRTGIFFLVLVILALMAIYHYVDFSSPSLFDINSEEIIALQLELDSIRKKRNQNNKTKRYSFNPNYIDDFKGYTLGMSTEEIDRLLQYISDGKWINSIADFKRITKV